MMRDYTPEGIMRNQMDLSVAYLNLIDKKLSKMNRRLGLLVAIGVVTLAMKLKAYEEFTKMKGE